MLPRCRTAALPRPRRPRLTARPPLVRFVGSFLGVNLFVGVVVDNFNRIKAERDGSAIMTKGQQQWVQAMKAAMSQTAEVRLQPDHWLGRLVYPLFKSRLWEWTVKAVLVLNVVVLMAQHALIGQEGPLDKGYERPGLLRGIADTTLYHYVLSSCTIFFSVEVPT